MANNTHGSIIAVDKFGRTHIMPAGNKSAIDSKNKYKAPGDRTKYFDYDPSVPEHEYVRMAKGTAGGSQDFAVKKLAEKNQNLEKANQDKDAEIAKLKALLAAQKDADVTDKLVDPAPLTLAAKAAALKAEKAAAKAANQTK